MHVVMKAGSLTFDIVQLKKTQQHIHISCFRGKERLTKQAALRRLAVIDIS